MTRRVVRAEDALALVACGYPPSERTLKDEVLDLLCEGLVVEIDGKWHLTPPGLDAYRTWRTRIYEEQVATMKTHLDNDLTTAASHVVKAGRTDLGPHGSGTA